MSNFSLKFLRIINGIVIFLGIILRTNLIYGRIRTTSYRGIA